MLSGVDLDLAAGDVVAVAGGNGAGKSTLLRVIAGLTRPSGGVLHDRPAALGYVPERFPPHDRMSARSYLTHMGRVRGLRTAQAGQRAGELLERLALAGGADTALRQLSKGNAQKVALAQALLVPPELLVLDEPWSGLDTSAHGALGEIIGDVRRAGGCVVFTDHRETVTSGYATHTYRIISGRLKEEHHADLARIELRRTAADAVDLGAVVELVDMTEHGATMSIAVAGARCDEVLYRALAGGWSVVAVRRSVVR